MKKIKYFLKIIILVIFGFLKDIYKTFTKLTKCDVLDIIQLIGFGLIINGAYGFYKELNLSDLFLVLGALYGTLKAKHSSKENKCLEQL